MQELETHKGQTLPNCYMCTHKKEGRSMKEATLNKGISTTKSLMDTFARTAKTPSNQCTRGEIFLYPPLLHRRKMTA